LSRLFISHSSKDNVAAKAFKQWLAANGWPDEEVFLDLDDINAGERWKEALRNANTRCEAVILLASPDTFTSPECLAEVRKAEDYGKEIIVVLLRDLEVDDRRLDSYKDRQIVNLATPPQTHIEHVSYRGDQYEVQFNPEALGSVKEYLFKRGIAPGAFPWPPRGKPDAEPFPGLNAFTEDDAGIFFGRDSDILRGLDKLRLLRRDGRPRVLVIQAASGAGKSSYLRAGLWPRLERDPDFEAIAILRPSQGILTGPEGLGRKLAQRLSRPARPINPGDIHAKLLSEDASKAAEEFIKLMAMVAAQALEQRRIGDQAARPPALILAIDQAEELFASEYASESQRFLFLFAALMRDHSEGLEPFGIMTIRSDGAAQLLQTMTDQKMELPEVLPLLPLPRTSYRDVILKPLELLARRGQKLTISTTLADRLVDDASGADALPLLAFTLSHLYQEFRAGGSITLEQYEAMGGVAGSIQLALKRALAKPSDDPAIPAAPDAQLACIRAAFIPWLVRINPESIQPIRRIARMKEFPPASLAMVKRLDKARLLVVDHRSGADVVEVAHESLLRQWPDLKAWLKADAEDLEQLETIERAADDWVRNEKKEAWLDHRAERLVAAESVLKREEFRKRLSDESIEYVQACRARETADREKDSAKRVQERRKDLRVKVVVGGLVAVLLVGLAAWKYQKALQNELYRFRNVQALSAEQEHALKPRDSIKECTDCPKMIVIPAGNFKMGSAETEHKNEIPQHDVSIAEAFAVSENEVTFDEWEACVSHGNCRPDVSGNSWERRGQPVISVSWDDAQTYVAWLREVTGKPYRLLTEAEWEYAARGNMPTLYFFGSEGGSLGQFAWYPANAEGKTHPVHKLRANPFGLYDIYGNVWEWVEDCYHDGYLNAPANGSAWLSENRTRRVIRGGSWLYDLQKAWSTGRQWFPSDKGREDIGIRIARTLKP
jgi:formylglycine-generating enzyme required for sulfatase activity